MKSAKDRAIDIAHEIFASGFSRATFVVMAKDDGDTGAIIRKAVEAIERGIAQDRREVEKAQAPS